ncbi:MAG: tagaturonate reductase [Saprospiraceae bacterium]
MKELNKNNNSITKNNTERILQFGGGNFLRGFVDWIIDVYNEKTNSALGVWVVKPTERGDYETWKQQDGLFHILTKGIKNGKLVNENRLITCVNRIIHPYRDWEGFLKSAENPELRFIISNTTESGIKFNVTDKKTDTPPHEFPAKLTLWLYHRYQFFQGKKEKGCVMIPTELLIDNGLLLKECILKNADAWGLETGFKTWIEKANIFCNTLVDRIIPGVNKNKLAEVWEEIGFEDKMVTQGEPYHFLAIEAPQPVRDELPLDKIGLNIIYANDLTPYRTRKVRILNGAHTSMVPVGYLYGIETVRETIEHEVMGKFVHQCIFNEIIPTLDLPNEELHQYANDVLDRFKNPFIHHELISISLNATSKFTTRVLPSILEFKNRTGLLPKGLVFSMAALIHFYKGERDGVVIPIKDNGVAIDFLKNRWNECDCTLEGFEKMAKQILAWKKNWGNDLSKDSRFVDQLAEQLFFIERDGIKKTVKEILK